MASTKFLTREHKGTSKASRKPTTRDLEWAAGFLDGEGTFRCKPNMQNGGGQVVSASQKNEELPNKLLQLFGGSVGHYRQSKHKYGKIYIWHIHGARARGVMLTLYSLLSKRRQKQIRTALQHESVTN